MSISRKYNRTYHFDFSLGATSDDKINWEWRDLITKFPDCVHTEKLDGENTCLSPLGVFARSHAAPTIHPWANHLKVKQSQIVNDLKNSDLEIFGENLYAIHSIIYPKLEHHFYVFGVRQNDMWLSWDETKWYAEFFDFPVVPELLSQKTNDVKSIEETVKKFSTEESVFGSVEKEPNTICTREGLVTRNINEYHIDYFKNNVFKYVRENHVKTADTAHWTKNWNRAMLKDEVKVINNKIFTKEKGKEFAKFLFERHEDYQKRI